MAQVCAHHQYHHQWLRRWWLRWIRWKKFSSFYQSCNCLSQWSHLFIWVL